MKPDFRSLALVRRALAWCGSLPLLLLPLAGELWSPVAPLAAGEDWPEVVREDFQKNAERWKPVHPEGWRLEKEGENQFFHQFVKTSPYKPPHRSPLHIAMLRDVQVGDFELTARVKSTHPDYGHRDVCLFFGMQDSAHFYYVHLGKKTDDHANQIFIVNGKDRTKISLTTTEGTDWDDQWHRVKILRRTTGPEAARSKSTLTTWTSPS